MHNVGYKMSYPLLPNLFSYYLSKFSYHLVVILIYCHTIYNNEIQYHKRMINVYSKNFYLGDSGLLYL